MFYFFLLLFCLLTEICSVILLVIFLAYFQVCTLFLIHGSLSGCKLSTPLTDDNLQYVALIHKLCYLSKCILVEQGSLLSRDNSVQVVGLEWDFKCNYYRDTNQGADKIEDHLLQNQLICLNKIYPLCFFSRYKFPYLIVVTVNTNPAPITD